MDTDFTKALRLLVSYDLTKYNAIDSYRPFNYLTREESAKLFSQYATNVLCRENIYDEVTYTDLIGSDITLKPYIQQAYRLGLMKGDPNGAFRPYDTIKKQEFIAVLVRMMLHGYLSENSEPWYRAYAEVSKELGVMTQDIDPKNIGVLRHDAALMLFRAYKYQQFNLVNKKGHDTYILKEASSILEQYK